jgi:hypothetical protein
LRLELRTMLLASYTHVSCLFGPVGSSLSDCPKNRDRRSAYDGSKINRDELYDRAGLR